MTTLINKYPPRLSNIELLRLLAMLGVLVVHADFGALGEPTRQEWLATPGYTAMRTLAEAFAIVAVNVFVLISGWFGIRFRWSALGKLLFQCAFFFFGIYFTLRACGVSQTPPLKGIYMCLMFSENAWFVKAYVGMFILAPVMNAFMENATRRQAATLLVVFFTFQSLYGWLSAGATYIEKGYSAFSFMGYICWRAMYAPTAPGGASGACAGIGRPTCCSPCSRQPASSRSPLLASIPCLPCSRHTPAP